MSLVPRNPYSSLANVGYSATTLARARRFFRLAGRGYIRRNPYAGVAANTIRLAAKYGPRSIRAAGRIQRAFRKKRNKYFKRTEPSVRNPSRKVATDPGVAALEYGFGNLNVVRFPFPAYDNGTLASDNLTSRTRNTIFLKGIKICWTWQHLRDPSSEVNAGPLRIRWYLVQAKEGQAKLASSLNTNFFRTNHDGQTRNRSYFPNTGLATDLYDYTKICAPVNPNELVNIITKREFDIFPKSEQTVMRFQPWRYRLMEYFKIGKWISYDTSTALPDHEIYCVWWAYPIDTTQYDGTLALQPQVNLLRHDTVYWGEKP